MGGCPPYMLQPIAVGVVSQGSQVAAPREPGVCISPSSGQGQEQVHLWAQPVDVFLVQQSWGQVGDSYWRVFWHAIIIISQNNSFPRSLLSRSSESHRTIYTERCCFEALKGLPLLVFPLFTDESSRTCCGLLISALLLKGSARTALAQHAEGRHFH